MSQADEFAKKVMNLPEAGLPFEACAYYDPDGDCVEFFASNEPFRGERLDKWVTVYLSESTGEIVGGLIKGLRELTKTYPGLDIDIEDGEVKVSFILRATAWSTDDELKKKSYKAIIAKADENSVTTALQTA